MNTLTEKTRLFQHFPPPHFREGGSYILRKTKMAHVLGESFSHLFDGGILT